MCVIIHAPAGTKFPIEFIEDAWDSNPHGSGFAYTEPGGNLVYVKGLMTYRQVIKRIKKHDIDGTDFTLHFRWKTHGKTDEANTHPWMIGDKVGVIHNGIISGLKDEKDISDTGVWTRDKLLPWYMAGMIQTEEFKAWAAKDIGSWNKLVIHQKGFAPIIINEKAGTWKDGIWYSNTSFGGPFWKYRGSVTTYGCGTTYPSAYSRWNDPDWRWDKDTGRYIYEPKNPKKTTVCGGSEDIINLEDEVFLHSDDKEDDTDELLGENGDDAELEKELKIAKDMFNKFQENKKNLGTIATQEFIEYLEMAELYYPNVSDADIEKLHEEAEWHLFNMLEELEEFRKESRKKVFTNEAEKVIQELKERYDLTDDEAAGFSNLESEADAAQKVYDAEQERKYLKRLEEQYGIKLTDDDDEPEKVAAGKPISMQEIEAERQLDKEADDLGFVRVKTDGGTAIWVSKTQHAKNEAKKAQERKMVVN